LEELKVKLPGSFFYTRNLPIRSKLAEADAADAKETHVTTHAPAQLAAIVYARWELRLAPILQSTVVLSLFALLLYYDSLSGHLRSLGNKLGEYRGDFWINPEKVPNSK